MFKIISTELKKIVSKPGIYVLSVLLAAILVLGVFIYKPTVYESTQFTLEASTYVDKNAMFTSDLNQGQTKMGTDEKLENILKAVESYTVTTPTQNYTQKQYIELLYQDFLTKLDSYRDSANDEAGEQIITTYRNNVVNSLIALNNHIESVFINYQNGAYAIVTSEANYNNYKSSYNSLLEWAKLSIEKGNLKNHFNEYDANYAKNFVTSLKEFKYPTLSNEFVKSYTIDQQGTKLNVLNNRKSAIMEKMQEYLNLAYNDPTGYNIKNAYLMDDLANEYVNSVNTYINLIKQELVVNAFGVASTAEQLSLFKLSSVSEYNSKSLLKKYEYLFENNKSESDFSKPLTIGIASNVETNAYDYSYFVLRVFSFVIIVYAIMSACHSIAGEIKEGSMRYLSIRPVSRTQMFFGKWLSVVFMSIILMIFSFVISICVGGAVYGFSSNNILTIFNGSSALVMHPAAMLGIYLLSMLLELLIYSLIAMLLSVLFKSDLLSTTILLVIYLLNTLLPMFIQGANTWLVYYPFSHISLYALFGSTLYAQPNNFLNLVFGAKIFAGSNIGLTLGIISLFIIILSILSIKFFKRKEL